MMQRSGLAAPVDRSPPVAAELRPLQQRLLQRSTRPGRQPAPDGAEQLPPIPADVMWLRAACVAILARAQGEVG